MTVLAVLRTATAGSQGKAYAGRVLEMLTIPTRNDGQAIPLAKLEPCEIANADIFADGARE